MFVVDASQMTWTRLIWDLHINSGVKSTKITNLWVAYCFKSFYVG